MLPDWLQVLGVIGDFLGGVFALAAFGFALWAAYRAVPAELEKFRATKREEKQAEIAREVWIACYRLTSFASGVQVLPPTSDTTAGTQEFIHNSEELMRLHDLAEEAEALASLYLPGEVLSAVRAVGAKGMEVLAALEEFDSASHADKPIPPDIAAFFGPGAGARTWEVQKALWKALRPIALLDLPPATRAETLPAPPTKP